MGVGAGIEYKASNGREGGREKDVKGWINKTEQAELRSEAVHFFFLQAGDGIREKDVTGVQRCALAICAVCQVHEKFS